jgi:hypothetical protein
MLSPLCKAQPVHVNGQVPVIRTVNGLHLAKATVKYPARQRAQDAAAWLRGEVAVKPTLKQAARTFRVSIPLVVQARERLEQVEQRKRHLNGGSAPTLSDSAVENIVRELGVDRIWRALEKLTQPELPFMAAAE